MEAVKQVVESLKRRPGWVRSTLRLGGLAVCGNSQPQRDLCHGGFAGCRGANSAEDSKQDAAA